jgi:predicted Rossmann fold nucleotide-binding protein DprA/Smf involved in DNA uptake
LRVSPHHCKTDNNNYLIALSNSMNRDIRSTIKIIISGGQTGVDRAALDVALSLGIPCGGWCPKGRRAVDGIISDRYPLQETETSNYKQRTRLNVRDSDGTLVINRGALDGGTAYTVELADKLEKPCLVVDADDPLAVEKIRHWLINSQIRVLNVAGPREEKRPEISGQTINLLHKLFS